MIGIGQPLVDAGVELDVRDVQVLHVQRVAQRAGHEQAAARDGQDDVGPVAVVGDHARRAPGRRAEQLPGQRLALAHARTGPSAVRRASGGAPARHPSR